MKQRTRYSKEYKLDAISLVLDRGYTQTPPKPLVLLGRWSREHKAQIKRLEMERDIQKKATVFFVAETRTGALNTPVMPFANC